MRIACKLCLLAVAIVAAGMLTPSARADGNGCCGGWGAGWPYNFQSGIYGRANAYSLPYFSLHPPVYYSYVVPRPYGYSPFAIPPGCTPAESAAPAPKEVLNPHYKPRGEEPQTKKTSDRTT